MHSYYIPTGVLVGTGWMESQPKMCLFHTAELVKWLTLVNQSDAMET